MESLGGLRDPEGLRSLGDLEGLEGLEGSEVRSGWSRISGRFGRSKCSKAVWEVRYLKTSYK